MVRDQSGLAHSDPGYTEFNRYQGKSAIIRIILPIQKAYLRMLSIAFMKIAVADYSLELSVQE
jgi:hypothetical protein